MLEKAGDIEVIGEAEEGNEVLDILKTTTADVVLMDLDLGRSNGIEVTQKVKTAFPLVHILALTMHGEQDNILRMLEAGAGGYLLKTAGREELLGAIHAVVRGDSYFSNTISATLLKSQANHKSKTPPRNNNTPLSDREIEVLKLIAQEFSNGEIAEKLFISIRTVDTHRRNILEKLPAKNTAGLVKYAIEKALV
jgi:DNA-binding NarL/FixJ family response regulator